MLTCTTTDADADAQTPLQTTAAPEPHNPVHPPSHSVAMRHSAGSRERTARRLPSKTAAQKLNLEKQKRGLGLACPSIHPSPPKPHLQFSSTPTSICRIARGALGAQFSLTERKSTARARRNISLREGAALLAVSAEPYLIQAPESGCTDDAQGRVCVEGQRHGPALAAYATRIQRSLNLITTSIVTSKGHLRPPTPQHQESQKPRGLKTSYTDEGL